MELDLQTLFGLLCRVVLIGWDPATPPLPLHLGSKRALLVNWDRRHLFVTPCITLNLVRLYIIIKLLVQDRLCLYFLFQDVATTQLHSHQSPAPIHRAIYWQFRTCCLKLLRSPRIDSKEPIPPGCVIWRADNPIPNRFLAPTHCLKIPAQVMPRKLFTSNRRGGGGEGEQHGPHVLF